MASTVDHVVNQMKAAGDETRIRLLALLRRGERTVKELTEILGQSQPRISRHLKVLAEAGLVSRSPEGSWVYYRLSDDDADHAVAVAIVKELDPRDARLKRDGERLAILQKQNRQVAERYFAEHAGRWDAIRSLHVPERQVEAAMLERAGEGPFRAMLDIGTGTGRMLELFAGRCERALGVDLSPAMLAVARANLERAAIQNARVKLGDVMNLPVVRDSFDLVIIHQVLHFLDEPAHAIAEAAAALSAGGRLIVVDFAPHELEDLREAQAHRRLGFSRAQMKQWIAASGPQGRGGGRSRARIAIGRADRHHLDRSRPARIRGRPWRDGSTAVSGADATPARLPEISFEFFPPKTETQAASLDGTVRRLARFRPRYVSVTYGAGGTSQERSLGTVRRMHEFGLATAAHITCAGAPRDSLEETIGWFRKLGIERFVALRGDPPGGLSEPYAPHPSGFRDTADLVAALKRAGAAEVSVSAYPERHPHSPDWETEIEVLKRKVDAGADRAITQFFFDNDSFDAYRERVRRAGIDIPLVPGIMPIHRFTAVRDFARRCGATIPERLARRFDGLGADSETHGLVAAAVASEQIADLVARGVEALHIYTLNRAELTEAICRVLGVESEAGVAACAA